MKAIYQTFLKYLFLIILACVAFNNAEAGVILPSFSTAQVCEDATCTVSSTSPVNFGVFTSTPTSNVVVNNTELHGFIWGASFGWAVLNCGNTTSGCSATNGNFKVANDGLGHLSGYAWGESSGWINFGPFPSSGTAQIAINNIGEFNGYAWSQNNGWIKFDCVTPGSQSCVKTDWRISGGGGDNGGGGCTVNCNPPTVYQCSDGIDNDSDSKIDYPADPGCTSVTDNSEVNPTPPPTVYQCNDRTDNDNDGLIDYPADPGCTSFNDDNEYNSTGPDCTGPNCNQLNLCKDDRALNNNEPAPCRYPQPGCTGPDCNPLPGCIGVACNPPPPPCIGISCTTIEPIFDEIPDPIIKIVTAGGALFGVLLSFSTALFANPLTFSEIFLIPIRLWSLLLSALGLKKRNRPWGIVYDSVTKQPLDPAYVILQDLQGNEVTTSITDLDGRYGFLVPAGSYRMIAHKTNYEFPSRKLSGKDSDELYSDLYFNEVITIAEGGVITKNIPMDPLNFDWNEFAKKDQKLMKFYSVRDIWIARFVNTLFYLGFALTIVATSVTPRTYNIITLSLYLLLFVLKFTVLKPRPFGRLKYKIGGFPLSFAAIKVYSALTNREFVRKVSDKTGKYYCLVPNGTYYVKIEVKNPDQTYSPIYTSTPIEVKNGYINKNFEV